MADLSGLNIQAKDNSAPEFTLLPKGYYKVVALKEELKETKDGNGKYISIEFEVLDNKRKLWESYNIVNSNAVTVKIATEQLESFAWAVKITTLKTSEELLYKEFNAYIDIDAGKNGYASKNKIKGYYPISWTVSEIEAHRKGKSGSVSPSVLPAATVASAPVTAGASPWAKK